MQRLARGSRRAGGRFGHRAATVLLLVANCVLFGPVSQAGEWRGFVSGEWLAFTEDALSPEQHDSYLSVAFEPEYIHEWNRGDQLFTFKPFFRASQYDSERTHADIRELSFINVARDWEILVGIGKVFWGVTESVHLVDIINQTDLVENTDTEDKLGQPMIDLTLIRDWGIIDLFVLPGFRERTFPGTEGRPRFSLPVDTNGAIYESGAQQNRIDLAARWSHSIGDWDIGIAHFYGTSREPRFVPRFPGGPGTPPDKVRPLYEVINQTSLDLQATIGSWLWKLEAFTRTGQGAHFTAAAGGFEYTFVGVFETSMDVGWITEYLFDDRDDNAPTNPLEPFSRSPFQNDVVFGARLTWNDPQSTELLASVIYDLDGDGQTFGLEASRRLGDSWKVSLEARGVANVDRESALQSFTRDNLVRLDIARYF